MSLRLMLGGAQQPEPGPDITTAVLIFFVVIVVGVAVAKDPKLAVPIGTAAAVGALLIAMLIR